MPKEFDIYTIIGLIIAIALAILSPSIPKIDTTIGLINGLIVFFILILLVIILNLYLKDNKSKRRIQIKLKNIERSLKETGKELNFIKERFKTLEDLTTVKEKIKYIERKIFKK